MLSSERAASSDCLPAVAVVCSAVTAAAAMCAVGFGELVVLSGLEVRGCINRRARKCGVWWEGGSWYLGRNLQPDFSSSSCHDAWPGRPFNCEAALVPCWMGCPKALRRGQGAEGCQEDGEAAREEGVTYRWLLENQHMRDNRKLHDIVENFLPFHV